MTGQEKLRTLDHGHLRTGPQEMKHFSLNQIISKNFDFERALRFHSEGEGSCAGLPRKSTRIILQRRHRFTVETMGCVLQRPVRFIFNSMKAQHGTVANAAPVPTSSEMRSIMKKVSSNGVQELLDFYYQELTMDELTEMHEQDIEKLESLDPVTSEDRMMVGNWIEGISSVKKVLQF
ncbi:hypothetical protein TNCV_955091 [Trichonephila clavipes]|nr:hypothetical protein TNCV_955091 [Trichonephila clavipes]